MLNFRNTRIAVLLIFILIGIINLFIDVPILVYAAVISVFLILLIYGSASIRSDFYIRAFSSVCKNKGVVCLTFDDGPDPSVTPAVLDVLRRHGVRAAFFCTGEKALANPDIINRIIAEGHVIGGHSYSHHFFFGFFSKKRIIAELKETKHIINRITGRNPRLFRPPYGVTNPALASAVKQLGLTVTGWSLKSKDTVINDKNKLLNRLMKKLKAGDIVLMHDTKKNVPQVLEQFIPFIRACPYKIVCLDEMINDNIYE